MNKEIVYIVTQYWCDSMSHPDIEGVDNIAVCETRELAEQIAQEQNEQSVQGPFTTEEWDKWLMYRDDNYPDPDDPNYCIFDSECLEDKELDAAVEYFSKIYPDKDTDIIREMVTKQWTYIDETNFIYMPCEIDEIEYYTK